MRIEMNGELIAETNSDEAADAVLRLVYPQIRRKVSGLGATILILTACSPSPNPPTPAVVPPVASQPAHKPPDCTNR